MDTRKLSIIHQKSRGTYPRNQQIRQLVRDGQNMAQVGRWFKLSRQAIRMIVAQTGEA